MDVYDTGKVKIGLRYDKPTQVEMSDEDIALQSVLLDKKQARRQFIWAERGSHWLFRWVLNPRISRAPRCTVLMLVYR